MLREQREDFPQGELSQDLDMTRQAFTKHLASSKPPTSSPGSGGSLKSLLEVGRPLPKLW